MSVDLGKMTATRTLTLTMSATPSAACDKKDEDALYFWCEAVKDYASVKIYDQGNYRWATRAESYAALKLKSAATPMKASSSTLSEPSMNVMK